MLGEPCEGLARCVFLTCYMCCRRSIFQHTKVAEVRTSKTFVLTKSANTEIRKPESLYFRNIHSGIAIYEICGRTMGLIARYGSMNMCPFSPLIGEILQKHICKRLPIVTHYLRVAIHKLLELILQSISTTTGKFIEKRRSPVGSIHLITVIKECMGEWSTTLLKSLADMLKIVSYSSGIEMVDYISLSSWCSTFYHLSGTTLIQGYHPLHTSVFRI